MIFIISTQACAFSSVAAYIKATQRYIAIAQTAACHTSFDTTFQYILTILRVISARMRAILLVAYFEAAPRRDFMPSEKEELGLDAGLA